MLNAYSGWEETEHTKIEGAAKNLSPCPSCLSKDTMAVYLEPVTERAYRYCMECGARYYMVIGSIVWHKVQPGVPLIRG